MRQIAQTMIDWGTSAEESNFLNDAKRVVTGVAVVASIVTLVSDLSAGASGSEASGTEIDWAAIGVLTAIAVGIAALIGLMYLVLRLWRGRRRQSLVVRIQLSLLPVRQRVRSELAGSRG